MLKKILSGQDEKFGFEEDPAGLVAKELLGLIRSVAVDPTLKTVVHPPLLPENYPLPPSYSLAEIGSDFQKMDGHTGVITFQNGTKVPCIYTIRYSKDEKDAILVCSLLPSQDTTLPSHYYKKLFILDSLATKGVKFPIATQPEQVFLTVSEYLNFEVENQIGLHVLEDKDAWIELGKTTAQAYETKSTLLALEHALLGTTQLGTDELDKLQESIKECNEKVSMCDALIKKYLQPA